MRVDEVEVEAKELISRMESIMRQGVAVDRIYQLDRKLA